VWLAGFAQHAHSAPSDKAVLIEKVSHTISVYYSILLRMDSLKLLRRPWLYARLGFLLDRHADKLFFRGKIRDRFLGKLPRGVVYLADKRPGNRWVPTWKLMVPETLLPSSAGSVRT
jgi:hypothetical protein